MKPLTLEETGLKEELKRQYFEESKQGVKNARDKFELLCHLENFELLYWELEKENEGQKEIIDKLKLENNVLKEQMVAMAKPSYTFNIR